MRQKEMVLVLLCLIASPVLAQGPDLPHWERLNELEPGERIEVVDVKLKKTQGKFLRLSADSISLMSPPGAISIPKGDVLRVGVHGRPTRSHLWTGILIGALAGLAAGAVADYKDDVDGTDPGSNHGKIGGILVGAGSGAALGAAIPGYRTIYRAEKAK